MINFGRRQDFYRSRRPVNQQSCKLLMPGLTYRLSSMGQSKVLVIS